jgi:hypothetical protein
MANILEISPSRLLFLGDEIDVTRTIEFVTTCALGTAAMDGGVIKTVYWHMHRKDV